MGWFPWEHPNLVADARQPSSRPLSFALFHEPRQRLRPMRVMVSADLLQQRLGDYRVDFLLQLLATPPIEGMLFDPDGPPVTTSKAQDMDTGCESFVDWIAIDGADLTAPPVILHWENERPVKTSLRRMDSLRPRFDGDIAPGVLIGDRANCDLFVTGVDAQPDASMSGWSRLTVLPAHEALPLIGLYLRRQGEFVRHRSPALGQSPSQQIHVVELQSEYFRKAVQIFLPAAASGPSSHRTQFTIPGSHEHRVAVIWRFQQVLQARDRLLRTLAVAPRDYETVDRAASELELILMWLMAAFDITARLIHVEYALEGDAHHAGWQDKRWRGKLKTKLANLAVFFRGDAPAGSVLSIVQSLRNSIHGADPVSGGGISFVAGPNAMQYLVSAPTTDRTLLNNALVTLGGMEAWGVQEDRTTGTLWIHPGRFVERLIPAAALAINGSLETDPDFYRRAAPVGGPYELQLGEKRILWQLGFNEGDVPER